MPTYTQCPHHEHTSKAPRSVGSQIASAKQSHDICRGQGPLRRRESRDATPTSPDRGCSQVEAPAEHDASRDAQTPPSATLPFGNNKVSVANICAPCDPWSSISRPKGNPCQCVLRVDEHPFRGSFPVAASPSGSRPHSCRNGLSSLPRLCLRAYGRSIAFEGPTDALAVARELLPPSYRPGSAPVERSWAVDQSAEGWSAVADGDVLAVRTTIVEATETVLSDLELWVAEGARKRVFVHAGCVVAEGNAMLLPGRSMSGKSTWTAALVRAGADYYSDEYAVFDSKGLVRPYPRMSRHQATRRCRSPAGTDRGTRRQGRQGPGRVKLIAVLRFDPEAGWQPEPLTRGPAVLRLLDNTVAARSRPRAVLSALEVPRSMLQALEGHARRRRRDGRPAAVHALGVTLPRRLPRPRGPALGRRDRPWRVPWRRSGTSVERT